MLFKANGLLQNLLQCLRKTNQVIKCILVFIQLNRLAWAWGICRRGSDLVLEQVAAGGQTTWFAGWFAG